MKTLLTSLIIFSTATLTFADYNSGLTAYRKGDYQTAIREFKPSAENGDPKAQFALGRIYEDGKGVPQDYELAIKWYRQAAGQGHAGAQSHLGNMYAKGYGTKPDAEEAIKWHCLAAEQGYAKSQYDLGIILSRGKTTGQDQIRAHM